ncbi:MAG: glycosyltransferase [Ignavibacteria bacterium]|nr:glycosyltransferase [Ignavibacteria bacterium]MBI3765251.1 glycosyltransferase [Ignavibacteriales bacterium]
MPLLLIDNGSHGESISKVKKLQEEIPEHTTVLFNDRNIHHGPAMDQALHQLASPNILLLDSDCEVRDGGFIEAMTALLSQYGESYIIGKRIFMNRRGFDVEESANAIPYIRPMCMMVRREYYLTLPKFQKHGTTCLENMKAAVQRGFVLLHFPIEDYIHHEGRGTAGKFGYQLGWRGKLNYLLNRFGI